MHLKSIPQLFNFSNLTKQKDYITHEEDSIYVKYSRNKSIALEKR